MDDENTSSMDQGRSDKFSGNSNQQVPHHTKANQILGLNPKYGIDMCIHKESIFHYPCHI